MLACASCLIEHRRFPILSTVPRIKRRVVSVLVVLLLGISATQLRLASAETSYASRIRELSEPDGAFDTDNLISNEGSYLDVIPALADGGVTGGAYVGVGPDQNFSYIAQIRPSVAYIIDLRRDNLLLHLRFKALFASAARRIDYLCLLTGRAPPGPAAHWQEAPLDEILAAVEHAGPRPRGELQHDLDARIRGFGVPLAAADFETIARFHSAFIEAGFNLRFRSHGRAPSPYYPTLRELVLATDRTGRPWSYLASEEAYRFVKGLQARDAIIPVVGDVSGAHALRAIGAALSAEGVGLSAFYISNVEDYLFRSGSFGRFADNLGRLPRTPQSMIIRSVFRGGPSVSLVQRLDELLAGVAHGQFRSYVDLYSGRR
jgi:hypothetical protein